MTLIRGKWSFKFTPLSQTFWISRVSSVEVMVANLVFIFIQNIYANLLAKHVIRMECNILRITAKVLNVNKPSELFFSKADLIQVLSQIGKTANRGFFRVFRLLKTYHQRN